MDLTATELRVFIKEMRAKRHLSAFSSGYTGHALPFMISTLTKKVTVSASIASSQHILDGLDWCVKQGVPELYADIVRRLYAQIDQHYIKAVLVPLVPRLRSGLPRNSRIWMPWSARSSSCGWSMS